MRGATLLARIGPGMDTAVIALLALLVAGPGINRPDVLVFDELYYVSDAVRMLEVGVPGSFAAHPPLGSWLIAAGITVGGGGPGAWRAASLLSGVAAVVALHRLALRLAGRVVAAVAALLLITDGTWLVLSRTAMLDGPLTALVVVATAVGFAGGAGRGRWRWVLLAGALAGAATAIKWSGAVALPLSLLGLLRRADRGALTVAVAVASAIVVYGATWVPFAMARDDVPLASCPVEAEPCATRGGAAGVLEQHRSLVRYHTSLQVDSEAATSPSSWPLLRVPVNFHHPDCTVAARPVDDPLAVPVPDSCDRGDTPDADVVTFTGNPVLWYGFLVLLPALAAAARRDVAARVAVAGWFSVWLPWLAATRSSYLWYLAPAVPFAALGTAIAARWLADVDVTRTYVTAAAGAALGALLALLPGAPTGLTLVGWAVGGTVAGNRLTVRQDLHHSRAVIAAVTGAAVVAAALLRDLWVVA